MSENGTTDDGSQLAPELSNAVEQILDVLRDVTRGDLTGRLTVDYEETHPVGALAASMNAMIDSLAAARTNAESHRRDLQDRIGIIEAQESAIRELSTPIIEVWDGVICLPIVGILDSARSAEMTSALLSAVVSKKAAFAVIDITGIHVMDTSATDHFIRMARSVRLLGAQCVLSGVNPDVALTIVRMGAELTGLKSFRNMRDALRQCVRAVALMRQRMGGTAKAARQ